MYEMYFTSLVNAAEMQTQVGHYTEAMETYHKAYRICPMKDLQEQMAWLMGEIGEIKETSNEKKR